MPVTESVFKESVKNAFGDKNVFKMLSSVDVSCCTTISRFEVSEFFSLNVSLWEQRQA